MSMNLYSLRAPETLSVVCSDLRVQKYELFLMWQNFLEKNLKYFLTA